MLLKAWGNGDPAALDRLTPLVYAELHRMARRHMGKERENTLQTTALVNEAYLRLVDAKGIACQDRTHFFALSAQIMRRILVDAARARVSAKRGGMPRRWIIPKRSIWTKLPEAPHKRVPRSWRWIERWTTSHAWTHERRASSNCAFLGA
jgi:RNA polymerase sigma factor (TIGR02999 family)